MQQYRVAALAHRTLIALLVGSIIAQAFGVNRVATAPLDAPDELCFDETGQCVRGRFLAHWLGNGGLASNGLPLTGEVVDIIDGVAYTVQYFERVRLEYHPENAPPYDVLLGQVGRTLHTPAPPTDPVAGAIYFGETGHNISGPFLAYWQGNGGLAQFGYPLTEVGEEADPATGWGYRVQYFERARFEYHPENQAPHDLLLGQLGRMLLLQRPSAPAFMPCNALLSGTAPGFSRPEALAWVSHQVVSGTIVEQLPPVVRPLDPQGDLGSSVIGTDYVVQVDGRLRGLPYERIHVRRMGGTLGDCTHTYRLEPDLLVGQRLLLFLGSPSVGVGIPTFVVAGGAQGYWGLATDGTVTIQLGPLRAFDGMPIADFNNLIRAGLAGTPPTNLGSSVVPLDQAPSAPESAAPK